jgi:predicted Zn-dependent protease
MKGSIYLDSYNAEYQADAKSAEYLSSIGYHPAGLAAYLTIIDFIEKFKQNQVPENKINLPQHIYQRHPKTDLRINKIVDLISKEKLRDTKIKRLNQSAFAKFQENTNLIIKNPNMKKDIKKLQDKSLKKFFFDANE